MTPTTNYSVYIRTYTNDNSIIMYTGITNNIIKRQKEHDKGKSRTTNRYNTSYKLLEILVSNNYTKEDALSYEKTLKKMNLLKKLKHIESNFMRWSG